MCCQSDWRNHYQWRHVSSEDNPADFASRGLLPGELLDKNQFLDGPPLLTLPPNHWPHRHYFMLARDLPELRSVVLTSLSRGNFGKNSLLSLDF